MGRRILAGAVVSVALLASGAPARAANAGDPSLQRLQLSPSPRTSFKIVAEYDNTGVSCEANKRKPLRARYAGRLEVVRAADGTLALVNELTFREYLSGLAEVPRSWPMEALKAQVIAARSYALYHYRHPGSSPLGYDLCSTDACQVYRGLQVSEGAFGDAWRRAVDETAGRVLLWDGEPIQAFYFSTSWGRTVSNAEGFGGAPLPYLRGTSGEDDDAPLAHWRSEVPLADLTAILRAAGNWSGGAITSARVEGASLVVAGGTSRSSVTLTRLRRDVNKWADCLFPERYPPRVGTRRLPQTVLSPHLTVSVRDGRVVFDGRGWGHGVGMSQYGARSLASRGTTAEAILAHFYAGLRPRRYAEPGALRVLLASGADRITIEADGAFTARGPNGPLRLGRQFQIRAGAAMRILRAGSIVPVLALGALAPVEQRAISGGVASVRYELPSSAKVRLVLTSDGADVAASGQISQISGPNQAVIELVDGSGSPLVPGLYELALEATDGIDTVRAEPVAVHVLALPSPSAPTPAVTRPARRRPAGLLAAGAAAIAAIGLLMVMALRWRRVRAAAGPPE